MFCTKCGKTISDSEKFCKHCGAISEAIPENASEVNELKRKIKNAGHFSEIAGWVLITLVPVLFFIFGMHVDFVSKFFQPRLWMVLIFLGIGVVLIILGRRIVVVTDEHSEWYLQVLVAAFGASIIYLPIAIYFLSVLNSWQKLVKDKDFNATLKFSKHKIQKREWIIGMVVLSLLLSVSYFTEPFLDIDSLYKEKFIKGPEFSHVAAVVVSVNCPNLDEPFSPNSLGSAGSGTLLDDGLVITASHIFEQDKENLNVHPEGCFVTLDPETAGEEKQTFYVAEPIVYQGLSDEYDLAFLQIYGIFNDDGEIENMDNQAIGKLPSYSKVIEEVRACKKYSPKIPDQLFVLGYPDTSGGYILTVTEGIISAINKDGTILTSAKISAGNSGGLAVNKDYCIIGIPWGVYEGKYSSLGSIISIDRVFDFIDQIPSE